jgi:hypothetical protein
MLRWPTMKGFSKTLLIVFFSLAFGAAAFAQDNMVTTEAIGPVSGSLNVTFPPTTCFAADTVVLTGNVHVVVQVDTTAGTMDVHVNLMTVKGTGSNGKYIGNGAASFLGLPIGTTSVAFAGDLYPPTPCRAGFTTQGALPLTVSWTLGTDGTLSTVNAVVPVAVAGT